MEEIVCIGNNRGVKVNAYHSFVERKPIIEIRVNLGSIALTLPEAQTLMELLEEAVGFWKEEEA